MANSLDGKVALVTGAARRIGASIAATLHDAGAKVAIHYRGSADEAQALASDLNDRRANSATTLQADLLDTARLPALVADVIEWGGRLDILVNNASTFYPTPVGKISNDDWDDLAAEPSSISSTFMPSDRCGITPSMALQRLA